MSLLSNNTLAGSSGQGGAAGYEIERSVRLNEADAAHFTRTPSSTSNRKVFTFSAWLKRSGPGNESLQALFTAGSGASDNDYFQILFDNDTLRISALNNIVRIAQSIYRDYSAWFHLLVYVDLNQASNSDKYKAWVNNEEVSWTNTTFNQTDTGVNTTTTHYIGGASPTGRRSNCYLADIHFIDGQALDPSSFGEFDSNGVWQPIDASGLTYGTNGFHLPFSDNSTAAALGTDTSGNSNTWTVNNLSVTAGAGNDSLVDSPTNGTQTDTGAGGEVVGNYATLNPLDKGSAISLANGNLYCTSSTASHHTVKGTIGVSTGKWYWEVAVDARSNETIGVANADFATSGSFISNPGSANSSGIYAGDFSQGSVLGFALDCDSGKLFIAENNTWKNSGNPVTGANPWYGSLTSGPYFPALNLYDIGTDPQYTVNFGQRQWAYASPAGFKALCTANLPDPTIADGSTAFDTKLYTGNGTSQTITGFGFSPDFAWFKSRSGTDYHALVDTVRGNTKVLFSNTTSAEETRTEGVSSFNSDGFSLGDYSPMNKNNDSNVAWAWDAGSSNTTIAAGGLNSSAYDQSQTWSSSLSTNSTFALAATRAFDGDLTTLAATNNSTTSNLLFTKTFTGVTSLRVYMDHGTTWRVRVNGGTWATDSDFTSTNSSWRDITSLVPANGTVTSIESYVPSGVNNGTNWSAVEVNGKLLVDSGVTPPNVPSIASTVRANPSAGFSIVSYSTNGTSGATVGHGLNATPHMIITKSRDDGTRGWAVYHRSVSVSGDYTLTLNSTAAKQGPDDLFTGVSSTTFTLGNDPWTNWSTTQNMIAYCFAPVAGYSSFGSYTGNGSADGPFVFTGFRPRWLLIKNTTSGTSEYWILIDSARSPSNVAQNFLYPNDSSAEGTLYFDVDLLSNGFKLKNSVTGTNLNTHTYIYAAFAEHPNKSSRAR